MTSVPTADAIMALDGPTLTLLAFELGMAPAGSMLWPGGGYVYDSAGRACWEPHVNLTQADALLRGLRAHGWRTTVDGTAHSGTVWAGRDGQMHQTAWPTLWHPVEALALLRCAVLAVASAKT